MDLQSLFTSFPSAQDVGLQFIGQDYQKNNLDMLMKQQQMDQSKARAPHELQKLIQDVERQKAELPGIQADSAMKQDTANMASKTFKDRLDAWVRDNEGKNNQAQLDNLKRAGEMFMQAEPIIARMPPPGRHAALKEVLGKFYRPEFDQIPAEQLGRELNFMGSEMMAAQQKMFQAMQVQGQKSDTAVDVAGIRASAQQEAAAEATRRALEVARMRAQTVEKQIMAKLRDKKMSIDQAIVRLEEEASLTDDQQARTALITRIQQLNQLKIQQNAAAAGVKDATTRELLDMPKPGGNDPQKADPAKGSLAEVQRQYPGVPVEQLKERYKKKYGVDLK